MSLEDNIRALLDGDKIKMNDKEGVIKKIMKLQKDSCDNLQVISDFDRTISKHHNNGELTKSSYCVFETIPTLPEEFIKDCEILYKRFRVIEDDPNMTIPEKIPHMEEWWRLNEKLLVGLPFEPEKISQAVIDSGVTLRDHSEDCFKRLNEKGIPVLVFSAGLGHVVTAILKRYNLFLDNMKVISNFFKVSEGNILGFEGQPLNVYNKNQHAIEHCDYFKALSKRTNVIVLGDSLGDANMAEGVPTGGTILKIGFLNVNIDDYLPQYLRDFDIVLVDDQTMDVFSGILSIIL